MQAGRVAGPLGGHVVQDENVRLGTLACAFSHARQPGKHPAPGKQGVVIRSDADCQRRQIGQYPAAEYFQPQCIEGVGGIYLRHLRCEDVSHHADVTAVLCCRQGEIGRSQRRTQWP